MDLLPQVLYEVVASFNLVAADLQHVRKVVINSFDLYLLTLLCCLCILVIIISEGECVTGRRHQPYLHTLRCQDPQGFGMSEPQYIGYLSS